MCDSMPTANYSFHTGGDKAPRSKVDQGNNANWSDNIYCPLLGEDVSSTYIQTYTASTQLVWTVNQSSQISWTRLPPRYQLDGEMWACNWGWMRVYCRELPISAKEIRTSVTLMFLPDGKITVQHIHTPGQQCSRLWKLHQLGRAAWQTQSRKNWLDTHLSNLGNGLDVNTCSCNRRSILISLLLFVKVLLWSQYTCDFISIFFLLTILIWFNTNSNFNIEFWSLPTSCLFKLVRWDSNIPW